MPENTSSRWASFGKAVAIVAPMIAIFVGINTLYSKYAADAPRLELTVDANEFAFPPTISKQEKLIELLRYGQELEKRVDAKLPPPSSKDAVQKASETIARLTAISACQSVLDDLIKAPQGGYSRLEFLRYSLLYTATLHNSGSLEATDITVDLPLQGEGMLFDQDGNETSFTMGAGIKLPSLRPNKDAKISVWSTTGWPSIEIEHINVTSKTGLGTVKLTDNAKKLAHIHSGFDEGLPFLIGVIVATLITVIVVLASSVQKQMKNLEESKRKLVEAKPAASSEPRASSSDI